MADTTPPFDPKLAEGVAYFEQMLQVMPGDRTTLEFLCVAYEQMGEKEKLRRALVSLVNVLLKEGDHESASALAERLAGYEEPDAQAAVLRVRAAGGYAAAEVAETPSAAGPSASPLVQTALAAERALVRRWTEQQVVDEATAATVLQRLAELADLPGVFLISALAILEKENSALAETAVAWAADAAGAPPVPVELFEGARELAERFPQDLLRVRGVLPFAKLGAELLVACLNPGDETLKRDVAAAAGGACRFYTAHPRSLEDLLDRFFAEAAAQSAPPAEEI